MNLFVGVHLMTSRVEDFGSMIARIYTFSCKSVFLLLFSVLHSLPLDLFIEVSFLFFVSKWTIIKRGLNTNDKVQERHLNCHLQPNNCIVCNSYGNSAVHLFLECSLSISWMEIIQIIQDRHGSTLFGIANHIISLYRPILDNSPQFSGLMLLMQA